MKRYNNLYGQITDFQNLLIASRKAQKGKRYKHSTAVFNFNTVYPFKEEGIVIN